MFIVKRKIFIWKFISLSTNNITNNNLEIVFTNKWNKYSSNLDIEDTCRRPVSAVSVPSH